MTVRKEAFFVIGVNVIAYPNGSIVWELTVYSMYNDPFGKECV